MEASQKLRNELLFEKTSAEGVVRDGHNPIWDYEDDLLDGPVIDIGCGQSDILLCFAATDRTLVAFDAEPLQLQWLKQLASLQPSAKLENWHFLAGTFPTSPLPAHQYALIGLSNVLHFFPLEECVTAVTSLIPYMVSGTQLYVRVHSASHEQSKVDDPEVRYDYFKHYFTPQDIARLFPQEEFEQLYFAEVRSAYTRQDKEFDALWVRTWFHQQGDYDAVRIEEAVQAQLADGSHTHLTALMRKR
ncbi:MAG: methyltransferase domain-containing protein [Janthinobacterium lividum]